MSNFVRPFSKIKDISDRRRLPRLGKIRLGVKMISKKTGKEYPKETDYFVCPEEVRKIYGDQPKELDVMFPLNEVEAIFPQRYIWYGQSKGAKCIGDGEKANQVQEDKTIKEIECPCNKFGKECQRRAHLMVILPKVSLGGIYQIDLGSYHSIVDINSALSTDPENLGYIMALVGRIAMVPLVLKRIPRETHGSGRKETHWTLQITFEGSMEFLSQLRENTTKLLTYTIAPPIDENPVMDEGAIVVEEIEEPSGPDTEPQPGIPPEESPKQSPEPEPEDIFPCSICGGDVGHLINCPRGSAFTSKPEPEKEVYGKSPLLVAAEAAGIIKPERATEHYTKLVQDAFPESKTVDQDAEAKIEELFGDLQVELMSLESQTDIMTFMTFKAKKQKEVLGEERYQILVNSINDRLMEIARRHRPKK